MKTKRLVRYLVLLLLLLGVGLALLKRQALLEQAHRFLSEQLSGFIGERVSFQTLSLDPFTLSLEATGLRVDPTVPDGHGPLVEIERVRARLASLPSARHIHLSSITITRPSVRLALNAGRLVNFPGIQTLLDKPDDGKKGARVDIDSLRVEDAFLSAADPAKEWAISLTGLQGELSLLDGKPGRVGLRLGGAELRYKTLQETVEALSARADLSTQPARLFASELRIPGASLSAEGSFRLEKPAPGSPRAELLVQLAGDLQTIKRFLPAAPILEGQVRAAGTVVIAEAFHAWGDLRFEKVKVEQFEVGEGFTRFDVTPERVRVMEAELPRGDGLLKLEGELGLRDRMALQVAAQLEDVELAELFESLGLKDPWVMLLISGKAEVKGFLKGPFRLDGDVDLQTRNFGVWSTSFHRATPATKMMGFRRGDLVGDVRIDPKGVQILTADLRTPDSHLILDGSIGFKQTLDIRFDAIELNVGEVSPLAGFALAGQGWGKGRVAGPFADLFIEADMTLFGSRFHTYDIGDFEGRFVVPLRGASYVRRALADSSRSAAPSSEPTGLSLLLEGLQGLDARYYADRLLRQDAPILMLPEVRVRQGRTRIHGHAALCFLSPLTVYAWLALPPGDGDQPADGRVADVMRIPQVVLEGDPINGALSGELEVMGPPLALDGTGQLQLMDARIYGQTVARVDALLHLEKMDLMIDELVADTGQGELAVTGVLGMDGRLEGVLQLDGLPLTEVDALAGTDLNGLAGGLVRVAGSFADPEVLGQVTLTDARWKGVPLGDTVLTLETLPGPLDLAGVPGRETLDRPGILAISGLALGEYGRLEAQVGLELSMPYDARLELSPLLLDPFLNPGSTAPPPTSLKIGGMARARGTLSGPLPPRVNVRLDQVQVRHAGLTLRNAGPVDLELAEGGYRLSPARLLGEASDLIVEGSLDENESVDLNLGGSFNLALLDALIPGIFQRVEGDLRFSGLEGSSRPDRFHIGGSLHALTFEGQARASNAAIRTVFFPPTIDQLSGLITVSHGNEVRIREFSGNLGGGTIEGRGMMQLGPDYYPQHYDLQVDGREAFIHYPSFLPPGLLDASLRFNGDVGNLLLAGDIWLKRMVYRERYNWEKVLTDFRTYRLDTVVPVVESDPYFNLKLNIHAPGTFYIRNNIGDVQLKGELQLIGDTNVMGLWGDVESVRGTLDILDNDFELTTCKIEFNGDYWNPKLDLRMQTQIQSYTIFYQVSGTLNSWTLTPGSDSGLSERDINSLMAFRTLADNITEGSEARAVAAPALEFLIGRLGIMEQLQAFTRLDRFTLVPATDASGNLGARVFGEKEIVQNRLYFSGYYDYAINANQQFLLDLEWRALTCCSVILRLDNSQTLGSANARPGGRLRLNLEFD